MHHVDVLSHLLSEEPRMSSIPYVAAVLQTVLTTVANQAARTSGFIQRQRQLTGASFVQALVFGFLANPRMLFANNGLCMIRAVTIGCVRFGYT